MAEIGDSPRNKFVITLRSEEKFLLPKLDKLLDSKNGGQSPKAENDLANLSYCQFGGLNSTENVTRAKHSTKMAWKPGQPARNR